MFDTNIFNHILDNEIKAEDLMGKGLFFITHIQEDEINNTKDEGRKKQLVGVFNIVGSNDVPTSSAVFGVSKWGRAKFGANPISSDSSTWGVTQWDKKEWTKEDGLYRPIKEKLDRLNKCKANNSKDSLIAETSIKNNFTLITHDKDLYSVTTFFHGSCANIYQVLGTLE